MFLSTFGTRRRGESTVGAFLRDQWGFPPKSGYFDVREPQTHSQTYPYPHMHRRLARGLNAEMPLIRGYPCL